MSPDEKTTESLQINTLERILATTTDGIVALNKQGKNVYANAAAERILGGSQAETLQRAYNQTSWKLTIFKTPAASQAK